MANVPIGTGPQNMNQPKPVQPAVLATNTPVQNSVPPVRNTVLPVQSSVSPVRNNIAPVQNAVPPITDPFAPVASKSTSNSPWDDDLDEEISQSKSNPAIIGSLDPAAAPLKVPANVEETVGKKLPAGDFVTAKNGQQGANAEAPGLFPGAGNKDKTAGKTGFFGGLFGKKKDLNNVATFEQPKMPAQSPLSPASNIVPPGEVAEKVEKENNNSMIKKVLILIPGLVVVFALAALLTEVGLLSIGVENVYGSLGVEQLWGGLSPKTELALGKSALTMQSHPDFKAEGKINITIDRAIKSDIVSPLLALTTGQSLARDESLGPAQKATQTASDDYYFTTNSNSNSNSNLNSNSNYNSNISIPTNANINSNNSNTNSTITAEKPTTGTKTVEGVFSLKTSSANNEASIKLNDDTSSLISLINNNNQLFVKTSGAVTYGSSDPTKYLAYNLDEIKDKSIVTNIFNLKADSGFSVKGARVSNEKIGNMRCYKYKIDSLEIGSSLSEIGITSDMVPTLSGDVWIGIKDKLIHKMSIKITTPVSSSVRMISLDATLSDFDVKNSVKTVSSSEQVTGTVLQNLTGDSKRKADATNLIASLAQYKADNSKYPISASFIKLNSADNIIFKALIPRYITTMPEDPKASAGWYYAYKSIDGTKCTISARLENQSDTSGALVNNVLLYFKDSSD